MRKALITAALSCGLFVGCAGGDGAPDAQRVAALNGRLDALEKRLAAAEQAGEPLERLRNDAASLDRRVSSLETSVRELAARPAPAAGTGQTTPAPGGAASLPTRPGGPRGPAAWDNPTTRGERGARRQELRALSDEFRNRLAELRTQPGGTEDSAQTQQLLEWYREQRRAIMRGEGRTDQ